MRRWTYKGIHEGGMATRACRNEAKEKKTKVQLGEGGYLSQVSLGGHEPEDREMTRGRKLLPMFALWTKNEGTGMQHRFSPTH